jgi:ABC-2 type transport system permease protein
MSPIHDQSYRRYTGVREPSGRGWSVIARAGIRGMLAHKVFLALFVISWVPCIVRAVQIYVVTTYPQAGRIAPVDAKMFESFIEQQGVFIFFMTVYVGSGLIANDRRANALQIYLSKPLLRVEYIGGKLAILMFYLTTITLLPSLFLLLMQVLFTGSFDFLRANLFVIPAVTLASLLRIVVASFTMLALSSLSKSSRYVAVMYAGAIFFANAMFAVLDIITSSTRAAWVSMTACIDQVTDVIFRTTPRYETPAGVALIVLVGLVVVSISVLERRVRGVEVVS